MGVLKSFLTQVLLKMCDLCQIGGNTNAKGSSSKALFNFAPRELLSITQAKFLCKRLFRVLLKSFQKYAILEDEESKRCSVGVGTDANYYESIGMKLMDVEQERDGSWYIAGCAPLPSSEELEAGKLAEAKAERAAAVAAIRVEVDGMIFDGDEE